MLLADADPPNDDDDIDVDSVRLPTASITLDVMADVFPETVVFVVFGEMLSASLATTADTFRDGIPNGESVIAVLNALGDASGDDGCVTCMLSRCINGWLWGGDSNSGPLFGVSTANAQTRSSVSDLSISYRLSLRFSTLARIHCYSRQAYRSPSKNLANAFANMACYNCAAVVLVVVVDCQQSLVVLPVDVGNVFGAWNYDDVADEGNDVDLVESD